MTKQNINKKWLTTLRNELHESIYNEVTSAEHKALRVLREPNKSRKQHASKIIVVVKDEKQAQAVRGLYRLQVFFVCISCYTLMRRL